VAVTTQRRAAYCFAALAAMLAGSPNASRAGCSAPVLRGVAGADDSRWSEYGAQGAQLVQEEGRLSRSGVEATLACAPLQWSFDWYHRWGTRDYDGSASTGAAVRTESRIRADEVTLALMRGVGAGAIGVRLSYENIGRTIEGTSSVSGYPERFRYWTVALGGRYLLRVTDRLAISAAAWAGGGPGGTVWVDLPRADPAELRLGSSRLLEAALRFELGRPASSSAGWSWAVGLRVRDAVMRAGEPQVLRSSGVPVGVASQPRTEQRTVGVFAIGAYAF